MLNYTKPNIVVRQVSGMKVDSPSAWFRSALISRGTALSQLLGLFVCLAFISLPRVASADIAPGVSLAWDRSASTNVAGYRVYFGPSSREYTNSAYVGNVTSNLVNGLNTGTRYFFAVTAIGATGLESDFSTELAYTPATASGGAAVKVRLASNSQAVLTVSGKTGQSFDLLATTNMTTWSVLGSATVGSNGEAAFTDTGATNYRQRYYRARLK